MRTLTAPTINISRQALKKGVVLLDLEEYNRWQHNFVPTHYLSGQAAIEADRLVEEGLREHRAGRTIKASSLTEALAIYESREKRKN